MRNICIEEMFELQKILFVFTKVSNDLIYTLGTIKADFIVKGNEVVKNYFYDEVI
jgi:hypothetical protein